MPTPDKPRRRSGYGREETAEVLSACLTVAVTLGAMMEHLCIVGGLVPSLIIDHQVGPDPDSGQEHPGTNDLDVGLAIALLDDQRYTEVSKRLRQENFEPDVNEHGNPTPQRWRLHNLNVTVDFLLPTIPGAEQGGKVQALEPDFGALITPGLELAFDERQQITIEGHTVTGDKATRTVPVCGPATFVVLKALAFGDRAEPKDAYDLIYVLRRWPAGADDIATRLAAHVASHRDVVERALHALANDFASPDSIGPLRSAQFDGKSGDDLDAAAADAHGYVDDLLRSYRTKTDREHQR